MYENSFYQQPFYQQFEHHNFYLQEPYQGFQHVDQQFQLQNQNFQMWQFQQGFQQLLNQDFHGDNFQQYSWNFQGSFQHQNPSFQAQNQSQPFFSQSGQIYTQFQQPTQFQDQQNSYSNQEDYGSSSGIFQEQLVNSMNQIQTQRSSTQESEFYEEISATPSSTQISPEMDFTAINCEQNSRNTKAQVDFILDDGEDTLVIQKVVLKPSPDSCAVEDD